MLSKFTQFLTLSLTLTMSLTLSLPSLTAQSTWNGGAGDFNEASNWSPSGVPAQNTPLTIAAGTATASGSDSFFERGADTRIEGGDLVLNNLRFLNAREGEARFRLDAGSLQHTGTYFIVGQTTSGQFIQQGGAVQTAVSRGFFLSDGGGGSSLLQLSGGSFAVEMNGTYNTELHNVWMGRGGANGGANDRLVVDGGNLSIRNTATAPSERWFKMTRNSSLLLESGRIDLLDFQAVAIGQGRSGVPASDTASMILRGGTMRAEVRVAFVLGWGTNGALGIAGGDLTIAKVDGSGGDLWIDGSGSTAWAAVEQSAGSVNVEGEILIARDASGTVARYTLSGGELRAADLRRGSGAHGRFIFEGGTLVLQGDRRGLENESWFVASGPLTADYAAASNQTTFTLDATPEAPEGVAFTFDSGFEDSGGSANDGVGEGGASINTSSFGRVVGAGSLRLDGAAASRVALSRPVSFGMTDPWTVSWWSQRAELGGSKGMIVGERGSAGNFIWLRDGGAGGLRFRPDSAASIDFLTPRDSAMRHYTLVADGSGQIHLYLDGVLSETRSALTAWTLDSIGEGYPTSSSNFNFEGWIDALRVTPAALDAQAVADQYAAEAPAVTPPNPARVRVFLLGGQSNAVGHAVANELPPESFFPQADLDLFNNFPGGAYSMGAVRPGLSRSGSFGPEISMGRWLADHYAEREPDTRVAIIKYAHGGTNLYAQWQAGGDGKPGGDGPEYQIFQDTVAVGMATLAEKYPDAELSIEGMAWMQGESDCNDNEAPNYAANLAAFINDVRATYRADLPFVVGRLSANQTNRQPGPLAIVMAAQTAVAEADPRVGLVDTDDFGLLSDDLHFSTPGILDMGVAFAEELAYLSWMTAVVPNSFIESELGAPSVDINGNDLQNNLEWLFGFDPVRPHPGIQLRLTFGSEGLEIEINRVIAEGTFTLLEARTPAGPWQTSRHQPLVAGIADNFRFEIPKTDALQRFFRIRYEP